MMKTKKWFAGGIAAVLTAVSAMTCTAGAADFQKGDVDKDGLLTFWDAMLTFEDYCGQRVGNLSKLTDEQKALADMDEDGSITFEDCNAILEVAFEEYDLNFDGAVTLEDFELAANAYESLREKNPDQTKFTLEDYDASCGLTEVQFKIASYWPSINCKHVFDADHIQYALRDGLNIPVGDVDFDGTVSLDDAAAILTEYSERMVHNPTILTPLQKVVADSDLNGVITLSDATDALTIYARSAVAPQA